MCTGVAAQTETAATIVERMLKAYADAASYQDEGVTLSRNPAKPEPDEIVFATYFRRQDYFRFDWTRHHPYPPLRHLKTYAVVWSDAAGSHSFRKPPSSTGPGLPSELKDVENMGMAIAGATGVSHGAAHHVLRLLSSKVGGFSLGQLESPTLVGTEEIEGTPCYHLTGNHRRGGSPYELWVGKTDYLIRKISRQNGASGNLQEETRRNIRINQPIPDSVFDPLREK